MAGEGEMNEVSRAIGGLEAGVNSLEKAQTRSNELFDQHCIDDDRRHTENLTTLQRIEQQLAASRANIDKQFAELRAEISPLADSVTVMRPIVDGYQAMRIRLAAWASIAFGAVMLLGWVVETFVKRAFDLLWVKLGLG